MARSHSFSFGRQGASRIPRRLRLESLETRALMSAWPLAFPASGHMAAVIVGPQLPPIRVTHMAAPLWNSPPATPIVGPQPIVTRPVPQSPLVTHPPKVTQPQPAPPTDETGGFDHSEPRFHHGSHDRHGV